MYNKGKQFENQLFIYGPKCKKIYIFGGGGPEGGVFNYQTEPILLSSYPLTHIYVLSNKEAIWVYIQNMNKKLFFIFGGPLRRTQVNENFRVVRPHHRADIQIIRQNNNHQFILYGPQYNKMCNFGYSGGHGWPINNRTGSILLPSYPLTYIYLYYI